MSAAHNLALVEAPGDVLSPSSANQYRGCGAKWYFSKIRRLPDPKTGALALGSCVHEAVGANFRQKIETKRDLAAAGVQALYRDAWARLAPETEFRDDENPAELRALGEALALKFLDEAAPAIEPAAVELPVSGEIGGVRTRGYIDLVDVHGRVIDLKTAARKPSEVSSDYRFQLATYTRLLPGASGEACLYTLTKTKVPQLIETSYTVQDCDQAEVARMYPLVQRAIRAGVFLPNRGSNLCSRKYCAFWRACQAEFGGEVAG